METITFIAIVLAVVAYMGYRARYEWEELHESDVPQWVMRAIDNGHNYMKGKTYRYKVLYEPMEQGCYVPHYYRKMRR